MSVQVKHRSGRGKGEAEKKFPIRYVFNSPNHKTNSVDCEDKEAFHPHIFTFGNSRQSGRLRKGMKEILTSIQLFLLSKRERS